MPSRRLGDAEAARLWERASAAWDIPDATWYPLVGDPRPAVEAFEADAFACDLGVAGLRLVLAGLGVDRVYEFRESPAALAFERTLGEVEFDDAGAEGYWFDDGFAWVVYASREDSVTVAGARLLAEVRLAWPAWRDHLWHDGPPSPEG